VSTGRRPQAHQEANTVIAGVALDFGRAIGWMLAEGDPEEHRDSHIAWRACSGRGDSQPGEVTGISTGSGRGVNQGHRPSPGMMSSFQEQLEASREGLQTPKGAGIFPDRCAC